MRDKNKNTKDKTAWKKHLTVSTAKPNNLGKPDNQISGNDDCNIQTDKANEDIMKNSSQNMKFDLNPSIEITINNIENDIWFSYLPTTASVLMTGKYLIKSICLKFLKCLLTNWTKSSST